MMNWIVFTNLRGAHVSVNPAAVDALSSMGQITDVAARQNGDYTQIHLRGGTCIQVMGRRRDVAKAILNELSNKEKRLA